MGREDMDMYDDAVDCVRASEAPSPLYLFDGEGELLRVIVVSRVSERGRGSAADD